MADKRNSRVGVCCRLSALVVAAWTAGGLSLRVQAETVPENVDGPKGICVVLGAENEEQASFVTALGKGLVYFQSPDE
ncbi:MAG TPA: hypothetical protein VMY42_12695, partial [Thermoguttaceae bacterium]|nr:hypothetical protein [Thermoguttaceae bacterium]